MVVPVGTTGVNGLRLIEVIPDVPPVVPLDLCLGVHLEVLTSSDLT